MTAAQGDGEQQDRDEDPARGALRRQDPGGFGAALLALVVALRPAEPAGLAAPRHHEHRREPLRVRKPYRCTNPQAVASVGPRQQC